MFDPYILTDTRACLTKCDSMKPIVCKHEQHVDRKILKSTIVSLCFVMNFIRFLFVNITVAIEDFLFRGADSLGVLTSNVGAFWQKHAKTKELGPI